MMDLEIDNYEKRAEILKLQQRMSEASDVINKFNEFIPMISRFIQENEDTQSPDRIGRLIQLNEYIQNAE